MAFLVILLSVFSLCANDAYLRGQALYQVNQGKIAEGIQSYKELVNTTGKQDYEVLEELALSILNQGVDASDPETQLLALYGASVSMNEKCDRLFERAYRSPFPPIQAAALNAVSKSRSDMSNFILGQAIGASHPLIRLEAALLMAQRKTPGATLKIESLMQKFEEEVHFLFPRFYAMIGDKDAIKNLRRLLTHSDHKVRAECLLAIANEHRDDLIREVKRCLNHPDPETVEAAIFASGELKDESAIPDLRRHAQSTNPFIQLAAVQSLLQLNQKEYLPVVIARAEKEDPFAITLLGEFEGGEEVLAKLRDSSNSTTRINACASLLKHKDMRGLKGLDEILIKSPKDLCFIPLTSPGGSLKSMKAIPSSRQNLSENPLAFEISLKFREEVLTDAFELPESVSFEIIKMLLRVEQNDLIPLAMNLLENHPNEKTIHYLKQQEQKLGSPFIRYYAALTLMSLNEEGPYIERLTQYLLKDQTIDLVKFRPFIPWEMRGEITPYELTPNDHSSLFIASLEALATKREEKGIQLLLDLLAKKTDSNRYIIAGLLLRTIQ